MTWTSASTNATARDTLTRVSALPATLVAVALVAAGMFASAGAQPAHADDFVPVSISGSVFEDRNGDGVFDPLSEWQLDEWMVGLFDGNTVVEWTATMGGKFTFAGVGPGTFTIAVDPPAAWVQTGARGSNPVTTSSGVDVGDIDFGYFLPGILSGYALEDHTGDGLSADDTPLATPVTIDLFTDGQVSPVATTTTIYGGYYSFASLGWGVYTVQERVPAGYVLTAQVGATTYGYSGFRSTGNDFDNFRSPAMTMLAIRPVEGTNFTGAVASIRSRDLTAVPADFAATIDWGDGVISVGGIINNPSGGFLVNGLHTYAEEGTYTVGVMVSESGASSASASQQVTVTDAGLHAHGLALPATQSAALSGLVATFTDDDPNGVIGDYSATINWGDGTNSIGTVTTGAAGGFQVSGSHALPEGSFTISSTVIDAGGASASASTSITVDRTPPTTTAAVTGTLGNDGWWRASSPAVLSLAATDNLTGIKATDYSVNGGAAQRYTGQITLRKGNYTVKYWSVDGAGNTETAHTIRIRVGSLS